MNNTETSTVDHLRLLNALVETMDYMRYGQRNILNHAALLSYWKVVGMPTSLTDQQIEQKIQNAVDKAAFDLQRTLKELAAVAWPLLPDHVKQAYRAAGL